MKQFTLNMNSKYQRLIVELKSWHNFEALLDTGALFPIWTSDEDILGLLGGRLLKEDVSFGESLIYEVDDKEHKSNVTIAENESNNEWNAS